MIDSDPPGVGQNRGEEDFEAGYHVKNTFIDFPDDDDRDPRDNSVSECIARPGRPLGHHPPGTKLGGVIPETLDSRAVGGPSLGSPMKVDVFPGELQGNDYIEGGAGSAVDGDPPGMLADPPGIEGWFGGGERSSGSQPQGFNHMPPGVSSPFPEAGGFPGFPGGAYPPNAGYPGGAYPGWGGPYPPPGPWPPYPPHPGMGGPWEAYGYGYPPWPGWGMHPMMGPGSHPMMGPGAQHGYGGGKGNAKGRTKRVSTRGARVPKNKGGSPEELSEFERVEEWEATIGIQRNPEPPKSLQDDDAKTTMMLRNIPNKFNQKMLLQEVDKDFKGTYDFFYLPIDFLNRCNVGYAFINFFSVQKAQEFSKKFQGRMLSEHSSKKVCQVSPAKIQGLENNIQIYKNSPLMGIPTNSYKPLIFDRKGNQKPFPENDVPIPPVHLRYTKDKLAHTAEFVPGAPS